ncbi:C40 family peptidase, partial [Neisseria meningitidis]|nr:C40 family peptidase [Neisseria meningitidis]
MFPPDKTLFLCLSALLLASCGTTSGKHRQPKPKQTVRQIQAVRISHIDRTQGSQELMLHSLGLIGTPYKWGGSSTATGFDCSGMIQFVYKNALNVKLPRTARDM